jgi:ubiquinone/menaquinone biosynthesis C-methylase UbiE
MTYQWVDYDPNFVRQRYDRLADIIPLFDWLFFIPAGLRKHAVDRLSLKHGDCVLDVGCGTGRNFLFLHEAIGPTGRIYGVDLSAGMLRNARKLRNRHHWTNIHLTEGDAADYVAPEPLDGVLFSLSYNTMPHHLTVLGRIWKQLRPGGRLVIMDSKLPPGLGGKLLLPFSLWMMRHTLLGNPYIRPWEHHAELVDDFEMEEFLFASYYVCRGVKPVKSLHGVRAPSQRQALAARRFALDRLKRGGRWRGRSPGTTVWTGRALQAESDDLEVIGVALLYPALERNVCVPGHHGYPRASDLIRAQHCAVAGPGPLRARGGSGRLL